MLRLGLDVVEVERWERLCHQPGRRVLARLFDPAELAQCRGPREPERLAGRWAAKEAVMKALGHRPGPWRQVVILRGSGGVPEVSLRGRWQAAAEEQGLTTWMISISHERRVAAAVTVATTKPVPVATKPVAG
ncbi:MAG TPA: holo-ACP synthase [Firmicutes bacterium]|nr:holo-ACP synthase [Bacillota bacterium]